MRYSPYKDSKSKHRKEVSSTFYLFKKYSKTIRVIYYILMCRKI